MIYRVARVAVEQTAVEAGRIVRIAAAEVAELVGIAAAAVAALAGIAAEALLAVEVVATVAVAGSNSEPTGSSLTEQRIAIVGAGTA